MSVFAQYLQERPEIIYHQKQLMGVLKDALCNDMRDVRVLQATMEVGVVETLKEKGGLSATDQARFIATIQHQYSMTEQAAAFAVKFWMQHITPELLKAAEKAEEKWDNSYQSRLPRTESYQQEAEQEPQKTTGSVQLVSIMQDSLKQGITIQWKRDPKASAYEIWRAEGDGEFQQIEKKSFALPRFTDTQVEAGKTYCYSLRMEQKKDGLSNFSNVLQITAPMKPPIFQIRQVKINGAEIQLAWVYQVGAEKYTVFRKMGRNSSWEIAEVTEGAKFSFTDRAEAGNCLLYKIECQKKDGSVQTSEVIEVNT